MSGLSADGLSVWWDGPADGPTNMAADEWLASEAGRLGTLLVRLYGWSQTTVSLGAFQQIDEARGIPEIRSMPLVRRPSGGGAIVHGSDLTYAAAVPKSHPWGASPQVLYDALHAAMAVTLAAYGLAVRPYRVADGAAAEAGEDASFFCFDRRSTGDLVVDVGGMSGRPDSKVMGSAQRRLSGVVLQHGSLLLRPNADVSGRARHAGLTELVPGTTPPDARTVARAWVDRIALTLGTTLHVQPASWTHDHAARIAALAGRFRDDRWTCRR